MQISRIDLNLTNEQLVDQSNYHPARKRSLKKLKVFFLSEYAKLSDDVERQEKKRGLRKYFDFPSFLKLL